MQLLTASGFAMAAEWYRKAADKGFAPAMNNLGQLYIFGLLGERNLQEAFRWHLAGAQAGSPVAAMNVALAYRTGQGVTRDAGAEQKWATIAPDSDSPDLDNLTLARTTLYGSTIDAQTRSLIRNAAAEHKAVTVAYQPMKPAAGIPTFHKVTGELSEKPREPTLKELQR